MSQRPLTLSQPTLRNADPKMVLSSSVVLTSSGLVDPFAPGSAAASPRTSLVPSAGPASPGHSPMHTRFSTSSSPLPPTSTSGGHPLTRLSGLTASTNHVHQHQQTSGGGAGAGAGAAPSAPPASTEDLAAALSQIQNLKAEIAGVETVLGYLKGTEAATTTLGRKSAKLPSQEQLRQRADALATARATARLTGAASATDALLLPPPLRGASPAGAGSGYGGLGSPAGGGSPARARSAGADAGGIVDVLTADTKLGRTWRAPKGPQPVGRGEAVILEAALDEALPPGAITAKYGAGAGLGAAAAAGGARGGGGTVSSCWECMFACISPQGPSRLWVVVRSAQQSGGVIADAKWGPGRAWRPWVYDGLTLAARCCRTSFSATCCCALLLSGCGHRALPHDMCRQMSILRRRSRPGAWSRFGAARTSKRTLRCWTWWRGRWRDRWVAGRGGRLFVPGQSRNCLPPPPFLPLT